MQIKISRFQWVLATGVMVMAAVWPGTGFADEFINLRFYPGQEPTRENVPSQQSPITLSFSGKIYQPPVKLSGGARLTPDEVFIVEVERANREGSKQEILALWDPKDRGEISGDLNDPVMLSRNRALYQSISDSAFVLKARYGSYTLFLVQHNVKGLGEQIQIYPIRKTGNGYVLTNDLADDPMFEFLYDLNREQIQHLETPGAADPNPAPAE